MRAAALCSLLLAAACGATPQEPAHSAVAGAEPAAAEPQPPPGAVWREDVHAVVDGGLGRFLGNVDVEPVVAEGRFRGFRVVELRPVETWTAVDLRPGDVVTSLNGMPIERETEAYDAFVALKTAKEIRVRYERSGEVRELVYAIVARDAPAPARAAAPQKAAGDAG